MADIISRPSAHLTWSELACHDMLRTPYPLDYRADRLPTLVSCFEGIRSECSFVLGRDVPIIVLSAFRTQEYNLKCGGVPKSQHMLGRALDLAVPNGFTLESFTELVIHAARTRCKDIKFIQVYPWGVHFDIRPTQRLYVTRGTRTAAEVA